MDINRQMLAAATEDEAGQADENHRGRVDDQAEPKQLEAEAGPEQVPLVAQVFPHDGVVIPHLLLVNAKNF
eukprot:CAMPEP_0181487884 /NCGR_PEP_ID=MMETSP1110-20121109/48066_1 /TAXON_ID=174948 /ORGANISM="Symbiodinium sp., Strain CCMP421" /LENGTH=70 /DNA_ID=CAMNT_0023614439 /DNA_START=208 /DNA_END=419 /DNA_ORIENTATION=+